MTALASAVNATPTAKPYALLTLADGGQLDIEALRRHVPVRRCKHAAGQGVYRAGQAFEALYLVHAGSYKTCELADDGREQVTGFRMRGDLIGAESIGLKNYSCDVIALEDSEAWELPYPAVLRACLQLPELQARITHALAAEVRRDRSWMLMLGTLAAERRVAAFLLDVAARYAHMGYSAKHFILRMSRIDMASFLALKHETVSRALSRLNDLSVISVQRREVRVLDVDGLRTIAGSGMAVS
ncbi:Crp/Fnr family transcriptional regulator [Dyella nitratireducens]|uniref:Crp/Fnr family transcriptional regulator n=1 Tax=Dyella nitratireducens TaxID=1849580 RepID=UPI00166F3479|nr:helix-turn-helix domain-containing protein [Dyella nitratireducens]GLQ42148.1 Crp/Fnr family transcriptional regulator [Dyella nitratireducens]